MLKLRLEETSSEVQLERSRLRRAGLGEGGEGRESDSAWAHSRVCACAKVRFEYVYVRERARIRPHEHSCATSRSASVMMSTLPCGWRRHAPRSATGTAPQDGGGASVSLGRCLAPTTSLSASAICDSSLESLPARSLACDALEALAPMRSMKSCSRFASRCCASTVARARAWRSSRSARYLGYVVDLYNSRRPPVTSTSEFAAAATNSSSCVTTRTFAHTNMR
eukprot:2426848-Pleurochrysis_carterae.AAC.2